MKFKYTFIVKARALQDYLQILQPPLVGISIIFFKAFTIF